MMRRVVKAVMDGVVWPLVALGVFVGWWWLLVWVAPEGS